MHDYLKCVIENRFTLSGYVMSTVGVATVGLAPRSAIGVGVALLYLGMKASGLSMLGLETLQAYRRTRDHIARFGRLDTRFESRYRTYCTLQGVALAAREAGLEERLTKST